MAIQTLTGNIIDITGSSPEQLTGVFVKAPTYGISMQAVTTTSPREVEVSSDGSFSVSLTEGKGYLFVEGQGWSDTIPLWVLSGMTTIADAIIEALHVDPVIKELYRLLVTTGQSALAELRISAAEIENKITQGKSELQAYVGQANNLITNALSTNTAVKGQVLGWNGSATYWTWAGRFGNTYTDAY